MYSDMGALSTISEYSTRSRLSVLVIDDDPLLLEIVGIQLAMLGCDVVTAESGDEGLRLLAEQPIELLVTDWQMPGLDGMAVVRQAREACAGDGYLHIVMMTARGAETTMRAALESGVDDFLEKPIQPIALEIAVASARRTRRLHQRLNRRNSLLTEAHRRTREALDRIHADLAAATALHERLLPKEGRIGPLEVARFYRPAAVLGGDSIGASDLGDGVSLFFVVDVRGHGVPAALDSFHLHHRLTQLGPRTPEALGEALACVNREIAAREDDSYATIACGLLMPERSEGWIVCAGHPPPLLQTGGEVTVIEGGRSMAAGWFADAPFAPARFDFPAGARLMLYSDGLTESANADQEEFGLDRLATVVTDAGSLSLGQTAHAIEHAVTRWQFGADFPDDVSLLAIEHTTDGNPDEL